MTKLVDFGGTWLNAVEVVSIEPVSGDEHSARVTLCRPTSPPSQLVVKLSPAQAAAIVNAARQG